MTREVPHAGRRVEQWSALRTTSGFGSASHLQAKALTQASTGGSACAQRVWAEWAADRDGIGRTPAEEAAVRMLRNHEALCKDTARFVPEVEPSAVDTALRVCVHVLLTAGQSDAQAVVQVAPIGAFRLRERSSAV
jgi:hypothetical protein